MIKKIISGGQTGADRAAPDVAINFNIPYGGWIPKDRKAEDDPLPDKYKLQEMSTGSYPARTEKNVLDSDGTVIFTHGKLTGCSKLTQKLANEHHKPCLHIDLNQIPEYNAVFLVRKWMYENKVEGLNVAGSRASKDYLIYKKVFDIIRGVYWTDKIKGQNDGSDEHGGSKAKVNTVEQAVEQILVEFPLKDQVKTGSLTEEDLANLQAVLAEYNGEKLDEWKVSEELYKDCQDKADGDLLNEADAATVILRAIWDRFKQTHRLRVVK